MNKLIAPLLLTFVLTSCAFTPKYDATEYSQYVNLTHAVKRAPVACDDPKLMVQISYDLEYWSGALEVHATHRPNHAEIKETITLLNKNFKELNDAYKSPTPPSVAYCKGKLKIAEAALTKLLSVLGNLE